VGQGASVSLGGNAGETLEANDIIVRRGTVRIGDDVSDYNNASAWDLEMTGGNVVLRSAVTTVNKTGGTLTRELAGTVTTLNEGGGTTIDNGSGTITGVNITGNGKVDCTNNPACTYTNINMWPGSALLDPNKKVTKTNGVILNKCGLPNGAGATVYALDLGTALTITPS